MSQIFARNLRDLSGDIRLQSTAGTPDATHRRTLARGARRHGEAQLAPEAAAGERGRAVHLASANPRRGLTACQTPRRRPRQSPRCRPCATSSCGASIAALFARSSRRAILATILLILVPSCSLVLRRRRRLTLGQSLALLLLRCHATAAVARAVCLRDGGPPGS